MDAWWQDALFASLTHLDADGEIVPELACRWQILDGGRTYVFELRKDARWSNGQPVTAWDFEYAWRRILDPISGSEDLPMLLYDIRNAEAYFQGDEVELGVYAQNDGTLVVQLAQPACYFLHLLGTLFAVPSHIIRLMWNSAHEM